jgi:signal transduction histidine kinase
MTPEEISRRYQDLQAYVGWTDAAAVRVAAVAGLLEPCLVPLIDDFYDTIERFPATRRVITGGAAQIARLKGTLLAWLRELLAGRYDGDYVLRRWRVGWRHVEIGLDQVYTNAALSRLRSGLTAALTRLWAGPPEERAETIRALNQLLDLDLAIIEDAYQAEYAARLQRSERLAAVGQVAGGVAHELRNPLNVVKTSVYYLLNARNPTPEKKAEHLGRIERQVNLADGVITALANFARMPVPDLHPFAVADSIAQALETDPLPECCQVSVELPATLPAVLADRDQLRIVFANLFRNAREAMPQGGRLTITGRADGDAVEVEVRDTGVGISPEHLKRVTEPLYSTKARGLGLGLALARSILEKNQGRLRVESEPGRGSTFTVRLQADRAAPEADPPGPRSGS